jgi:hypothetical protein
MCEKQAHNNSPRHSHPIALFYCDSEILDSGLQCDREIPEVGFTVYKIDAEKGQDGIEDV